jgi:hypothetical protein
VIPAFNAFRIPDDISDDLASIFDPFGNATHTALSFPLVGEDVLITGAGPDRHHGFRDRPALSARATWSSPTSTIIGWASRAGWARRARSTSAARSSPT